MVIRFYCYGSLETTVQSEKSGPKSGSLPNLGDRQTLGIFGVSSSLRKSGKSEKSESC